MTLAVNLCNYWRLTKTDRGDESGERRAETQRRATAGSELLNSVSLLFFASHDRHLMMIIGFLCEENHPKCNLLSGLVITAQMTTPCRLDVGLI